jgi:hypothetical protein
VYTFWSVNSQNIPRFIVNDRVLPFGRPENSRMQFLRDENTWVATYICKAKQVFPSSVTFQGEYWLYDARDETDRTGRRPLKGSVAISDFVVRRQGEKILPPVVLKERPFRVINATYGKLRGIRPPELHVKLTLKYTGKNKRRPVSMRQLPDFQCLRLLQKQLARQNIPTKITEDGELTDVKMRTVQAGSGFLIDEKGQIYVGWPSELPRDESSNIFYPTYAFQRSQIPTEGKLTFRALISMNDSWPLEINEVVRR